MHLTYNRSQANLRMMKLNGSKFENKQTKAQLFFSSEIMSIGDGIQLSRRLASFVQGPGSDPEHFKMVFKCFCVCLFFKIFYLFILCL